RQHSNLATFMVKLEERGARHFSTYPELHAYSVAEPESFWSALWDFAQVRASARGDRVCVPGAAMREARFFPDARLNYAENMLVKADDTPALIFRCEDNVKRTMTQRELKAKVARLHHAVVASGLKPGVRVAVVFCNPVYTFVTFRPI